MFCVGALVAPEGDRVLLGLSEPQPATASISMAAQAHAAHLRAQSRASDKGGYVERWPRMGLILLEALLALALLVFFVWWTMFAGRQDTPPPSDEPTTPPDAP
jgi:hypothetical protein